MPPDTMTPQEVTQLRESLGLSIAQFAVELGLDQSTIWRWENGESPVKPDKARHMRLYHASRSAVSA